MVGSGANLSARAPSDWVAVCHTGTRSQPPPESQGKLETQDCMGNVQGLKLGSVKIPLATWSCLLALLDSSRPLKHYS